MGHCFPQHTIYNRFSILHTFHSSRPVNLLLVDVGRSAEAMLDDIVHLMCSAHLPGLFKQEEQQSIIKSLKPVARAAGIQWSEIDRSGARCVCMSASVNM